MKRFTEYHAGIPVIKDKELLPEAVKKLAKLEDMMEIREKVCDRYCKYPYICLDQETLDHFCGMCELAELFEALEGRKREVKGGFEIAEGRGKYENTKIH